MIETKYKNEYLVFDAMQKRIKYAHQVLNTPKGTWELISLRTMLNRFLKEEDTTLDEKEQLLVQILNTDWGHRTEMVLKRVTPSLATATVGYTCLSSLPEDVIESSLLTTSRDNLSQWVNHPCEKERAVFGGIRFVAGDDTPSLLHLRALVSISKQLYSIPENNVGLVLPLMLETTLSLSEIGGILGGK